jgi:uncharacterized protein (TIGR03382 family)
MRTLATVLTLALAAGPAAAGVIFAEDFNLGNLGTFTYVDLKTDGPSAFEWETDGLDNFTSGDGSCAISYSGQIVGGYDHAIVSPEIQLLTGASSLNFLTNYQNFANFDFAEVDVTADDGVTWNTLLSYNEDHGAFYSTPGEFALIDLSQFAGQAIKFRFHHFNNDPEAFDLYWQVDDLQVDSVNIPGPGAVALLGAAGVAALRRRRARVPD